MTFFRQVDEDLMKNQQAAYSVPGIDEEVCPALSLSPPDTP